MRESTLGVGLFALFFICSLLSLADSTPLNLRTFTHGSSYQLHERQTLSENGTSDPFQSAFWIWTADETITPTVNASAGNRFFRFTYNPPGGKVPSVARILIAVDNHYELFVNGASVGHSLDIAESWKTAQGYTMPLPPGSVLFAIDASNDNIGALENPAGVLVAIRVNHTDGTETTVLSDDQWRASITPVRDFQLPSTDDSQWAQAKLIARSGTGPWPPVALPARLTAVTPGPLPSSPISSSDINSSSSSSPTDVTATETSVSVDGQKTNTDSVSPPSPPSSKVNITAMIGAIVGGVVGGFVIVSITLMCLRRKWRKDESAAIAFDRWSPAPHSNTSPEWQVNPFGAAGSRPGSPRPWQHNQPSLNDGNANVPSFLGSHWKQPVQAPYQHILPSESISSMSDISQPPPYDRVNGIQGHSAPPRVLRKGGGRWRNSLAHWHKAE